MPWNSAPDEIDQIAEALRMAGARTSAVQDDLSDVAAARELASHGITANVINPGPVDTGWISDELRASIVAASPHHRVGEPRDAAALVSFLCSSDGGWVNGQLRHSDGGLHT